MARVKGVVGRRRIGSAQVPVGTRIAAAKDEPEWLTARRQSLGRHLYALHCLYANHVLAGLQSAGFKDIRLVHTDILRNVEVEGSRVTDIAAGCNTTKQAAGQVIKELVSLGYVRQLINRNDTRVRMVVFTERGMNLIMHLGGIFKRIDVKLAAAIGSKELAELRVNVDRMIDKLK
jgi:DNA-binding MarR family transcriptional regulator